MPEKTPASIFEFPSGDVTQMFKSWTSLWSQWMGQFGFININLTKSSNPEMERRITENVAGYGKQLGRVIEVLDALLVNSATAGWSADQKKALVDFLDMAKEIAAVKGDYIAPTKVNVDRFLEGIRQLKEKDEKEYGEVVGRLRKELLT
jgi:ABC-type transporter Mla subunit MlaD